MRKFLKTIVLVVGMLGLTSANAAKKVEVSIDETSGVVNISLKNVRVGEHLIIKDFSGLSLYKKTFKEMSNFDKSFSLKGKDNGMYFVEVENDSQIQITPVLKNELGVTLMKNAARFVFKPQYSNDGDIFKVSLLNSDQEDVKVNIYTANGNLVITETVTNELIINRKYNTKELPSGEYTLIVNQGKETFSKSFNVE